MIFKSKDDCINYYVNETNRTSDWVHMASEFLAKHPNTNSELIENLTEHQIGMIDDLAKYYDDNINPIINFINNSKLNDTQLQVIVQALGRGLALDTIMDAVDYTVPYAKMNWMLLGIAEGFELFKDHKFRQYTSNQLQEIYSAFKDQVKYEDMLNPAISAQKMQVMRHARCLGLTVDIAEDFTLTIY